MGYYTQTEIDDWVNRAQHAFSDVVEEIFKAEEVGECSDYLYFKAYRLWSIIKAYSTTNQFDNEANDKLMGCLKRNGAGGYSTSLIGSITSTYAASLVKGDTGETGATGPQGTRGSIWTVGAGAPSHAGTEIAGDMYLRTSNGDVYRNDGSSWGSPVDNLTGATGIAGYGYDGTSTTSYDLGTSATITLRPNLNADGEGLAYVAGTRFLLTDLSRADTWMVCTATSYNPTTGALVITDTDVEQLMLLGVEQVVPGAFGASSSWTISVTGYRGATGLTGSTGAAGTRGGIWTTGAGAPSHVGTEIAGDMYLRTSNGDVYRNNGSTWGASIMNITGPTGATGATGAAGANALLYGGLVEHDVTGAAYSLTGSTAVLGVLTMNVEGPSGRKHVTATVTLKNTSTTTTGEIGLYLRGTLVNTGDTTLHPIKHFQTGAGDVLTINIAITTIMDDVDEGDDISVRGKVTGGAADMYAGNLRVFHENV